MSIIGGHGGRRGRIGSGRGHGHQINFNSSNNWNKRQEMKIYPHGTGLDWQTAIFTKFKGYLILNIESEFVNGSDIAE